MNYEWRNTPTFSEQAPQEIRKSYAPRLKPHNLFIRVDSEVYEMEPIEYLIGYSNGLVAVGMIKNEQDIKEQPLTMQFGNWKFLEGKEIYVGCTVIVKSYSKLITVVDNKPRDIVDVNATPRDFFYNQCFSANTQATQWAITNKPKIERSLGLVTEFFTTIEEVGRTRFTGKVYDQENKLTITIPDDSWPTYIKDPVEIDSGVVINWIKIEEPFSIYYGANYLNFVFPVYANSYLRLKESTGEYWVGWIDTKFCP